MDKGTASDEARATAGETPWPEGPWTEHCDPFGTKWIYSSRDDAICIIDAWTAGDDREVVEAAISRLIAAAPEMAEALRAIADLTAKRQLPLTMQVNDLAVALLAKIEGGES